MSAPAVTRVVRRDIDALGPMAGRILAVERHDVVRPTEYGDAAQAARERMVRRHRGDAADAQTPEQARTAMIDRLRNGWRNPER